MRRSSQAGFVLPELLIAMAIMVILLGATLSVWDLFYRNASTNQSQNDAQQTARNAIDQVARQLRNLASPTNANVKSIDLATDYDLVFQTVDPNKRRVRYCLDASDPSNEKLWSQNQAFLTDAADPGLPSTASCPAPQTSTGWSTARVVAQNVVNNIHGTRPVFALTGFTSAAHTETITAIQSILYVDTNPARPPAAVAISTGVFLRNQNQAPTLTDFAMTQVNNSHKFIFNGSGASDPEGRTLNYYWYWASGSGSDCLTDDTTPVSGLNCLVARGLTPTYTFPSTATGQQSITLKVVDPSGLYASVSKLTVPIS